MEKEQLYKTISDLIAQSKTAEVFELLQKEPLDAQTSKTLTLIQAQYNTLRQQELKGLLTFQEIQIRKNQINDKLLAILQEKPPSSTNLGPLPNNLLKKLLPLILVFIGVVLWWMFNSPVYTCPDFDSDIRNKILVIPFENVGSQVAKPELLLRDRINQLTIKNDLSAKAKLVESIDNMAMDKALVIAEKCQAGLLVWGTYSSRADSLRLILQYYFTEEPTWSNSGELVTLKDVTGLQKGEMLKNLDDAVFSLCGVIALRDGNNPLAKKWFKKVKEKEDMDKEVLKVLK